MAKANAISRAACLLPVLVCLAGCGEGTRVNDVGDCDVVIERMVCLPSMPTPMCRQEVLITVRKTPACLGKGA